MDEERRGEGEGAGAAAELGRLVRARVREASATKPWEVWATRAAAGGCTFYLALATVQTLAAYARVSAAHRVASVVGLGGVAGASLVAVWAQDMAAHGSRRSLSAVLEDCNVEAVAQFVAPRMFAAAASNSSGDRGEDLLPRRREMAAGMVVLAGLGLFRLLGGRFFSVLPSDYARLGAFRPKEMVRATLAYASKSTKRHISWLGSMNGCHTCGTRRGPFVADHMPPVKFVKEANAKWWRRLTGRTVKQHFYPQCEPCSLVQSHIVKNAHLTGASERAKPLRLHLNKFRAYHLAGVPLALGWGVFLEGSHSVVM